MGDHPEILSAIAISQNNIRQASIYSIMTINDWNMRRLEKFVVTHGNHHHDHHHHWAAVVFRGWAKASACRLIMLACLVLSFVRSCPSSRHRLSRSSLRRLDGVPCRFMTYGLHLFHISDYVRGTTEQLQIEPQIEVHF